MINLPKGTKDVLPQDSYRWHYVEDIVRDVARCYNAHEIRTPVFEHTELFLRGVGDTTDVVTKEMYTFEDKGGRSITLKPEGTAGVARSYIENGLANLAQPVKMYYITPVFRYERPQAGRLREHHQFGIEFYGSASAKTDAEVICIASEIFKRMKITNLSLHINSIGCKECRAEYNAALRNYFEVRRDKLCDTCKERLDKNPLRLLDCKEENCKKINQNAPIILDYLCGACRAHFDQLQASLKTLGIAYEIDPFIVRGLDYYSKTVFEFVSSEIGAKGTVCGGGRYDGLVASIGGKPTPGVGFGMGIERLLLQAEASGIEIPNRENPKVFIAYLDEEECAAEAMRLACMLRGAGVSCDVDTTGRSLKAQFKYADKLKADYTVIVGGDEIASGIFTVKNMTDGNQVKTPKKELAELFLRR